MNLKSKTDAFIDRLSSSTQLDGFRIIRAYPYTFKPTRLKQIVIAVFAGEINAESISLGEACCYGTYEINADIFIPYELGTPEPENVATAVVTSQLSAYPVAVRVSKIERNEHISCYRINCCFRFSDLIGGHDEQ